MLRFLFRWFWMFPLTIALAAWAGFTILESGFTPDAIGLSIGAAVSFIIFKNLKKKKTKASSVPQAVPVQAQPVKKKSFFESMLFDQPETTTYKKTSSAVTYQDTRAEEEKRRKQEEEERIRREREEYARKADYYEREYRRLLRDDPKCLNYQTRDAEYNKNYFRRKAQGRW